MRKLNFVAIILILNFTSVTWADSIGDNNTEKGNQSEEKKKEKDKRNSPIAAKRQKDALDVIPDANNTASVSFQNEGASTTTYSGLSYNQAVEIAKQLEAAGWPDVEVHFLGY